MKVIKEYRKATEAVAMAFTKKYFPDERYGKNTFWVGDEVGGVFFVCEFFFDVDRMITALEQKATFEQIAEYHYADVDWAMDNPDKPMHTNFKNYVKYGFIGKVEK